MKFPLPRILFALLATGLSHSAFAITLSTPKALAIPQQSTQNLYETKAQYVCTHFGRDGVEIYDQACRNAVDTCAKIYLGDCSEQPLFETCTAVNFDSTFAMSLNNIRTACKIPVCGDGTCDVVENSQTCPADCGD